MSSPATFIRYPYRPSFLTLLRRLRTQNNDSYARGNPNEPIVYASFQQHWDPSLEVPVLTLVSTCESKFHSTSCTRDHIKCINITSFVTGRAEQHNVTFTIPNDDLDLHTVKLTTLHAYENENNCFIKYGIYINTQDKPLLIINIFNLDKHACNELHTYSILHPEDLDPTQEHYLLGLSANRIGNIQHHSLDHEAMTQLDETDLINIGYKTPMNKRARLEHTTSSQDTDSTSSTLSDDTVIDIMTINNIMYSPTSSNWTYTNSRNIRPTGYPPKLNTKDNINNIVRTKPQLFPPGYFKNRLLSFPSDATVSDAIEDFRVTNYSTITDPFTDFAYYYFIIPKSLVKENLHKSWQAFYKLQCNIRHVHIDVKTHPHYNKAHRLHNWTISDNFHMTTNQRMRMEKLRLNAITCQQQLHHQIKYDDKTTQTLPLLSPVEIFNPTVTAWTDDNGEVISEYSE